MPPPGRQALHRVGDKDDDDYYNDEECRMMNRERRDYGILLHCHCTWPRKTCVRLHLAFARAKDPIYGTPLIILKFSDSEKTKSALWRQGVTVALGHDDPDRFDGRESIRVAPHHFWRAVEEEHFSRSKRRIKRNTPRRYEDMCKMVDQEYIDPRFSIPLWKQGRDQSLYFAIPNQPLHIVEALAAALEPPRPQRTLAPPPPPPMPPLPVFVPPPPALAAAAVAAAFPPPPAAAAAAAAAVASPPPPAPAEAAAAAALAAAAASLPMATATAAADVAMTPTVTTKKKRTKRARSSTVATATTTITTIPTVPAGTGPAGTALVATATTATTATAPPAPNQGKSHAPNFMNLDDNQNGSKRNDVMHGNDFQDNIPNNPENLLDNGQESNQQQDSNSMAAEKSPARRSTTTEMVVQGTMQPSPKPRMPRLTMAQQAEKRRKEREEETRKRKRMEFDLLTIEEWSYLQNRLEQIQVELKEKKAQLAQTLSELDVVREKKKDLKAKSSNSLT